MTMKEILNAILFLVPDAKFAIWENIPGQYQGEPNPISMDNFLIDWGRNNSLPCPTLDAIISVNKEDASKRQDDIKLDGTVERLKDDIVMKTAYSLALKERPELTFKEFVKEMQDMKVDQPV